MTAYAGRWPGTTRAASMRRNPAAPWRHVDMIMLGTVAAISLIGTIMVFSSTRGTSDSVNTAVLERHIVFLATGFTVMALVTMVDYRRFRDFALVAYAAVCGLLLMVISPLGTEVNGAQSWFAVGSLQLQPAELMKLATILVLAAVCARGEGSLDGMTVVLCLALVAIPGGLIMLQPDLGSALVFIAAVVGVLFVGGIHVRHLAVLALLAAVAAIYLFGYSNYLDGYQRDRLTVFVGTASESNASFQVRQAETAIGAGGITGAGLFQGTQTKLQYVPYQQSDFIFTVVGEELGFLGSASLLLLYALMAWRIWRAAAVARDLFGTLLCVGVLAMLLFQMFENMGMTMGIMPITGIPLPFLSYGGSSTIMLFAAIGLVLNVHTRRFA
jgi:rod shape determining protein RodA